MRKILFVFMLIFITGGCGSITVETMPLSPSGPSRHGLPIVVMPFSDLSPIEDQANWQRSLALQEAIDVSLLRHGFSPVIYEDVINFLIDKGVIKPIQVVTQYNEEHLCDYSDKTKSYVKTIMEKPKDKKRLEKFTPVDLSLLSEIRSHFNTNYVLRGRISDLGTFKHDSLNPLQTGILPFVFKAGSRTIFGMGSTETYDALDKAAFGAILGGIFAQERFPLEPKRFDQRDEENIKDINRGIWAGGGPALGLLSHYSGDVQKAVVHLELALQEASTGKILWANRIRVEAFPESVFSMYDKSSLFRMALQQAVDRLIEDLTISLNARS